MAISEFISLVFLGYIFVGEDDQCLSTLATFLPDEHPQQQT